MILRKPYAFFIKYFKLIHFALSLSVLFLIYKTGLIVKFFNDYLNSAASVVGQEIVESLFDNFMIIIPILIILLSGIILGIMFKKEKPLLFYFINIIIFIVVLVLIVYSRSFVINMETYVMNIKAVKLTHDLLVVSILLESFSFLILFTRGLGLNFKKFDFSSDIININISEKDKEEVELSINLDINSKRRNNKKNIRYFKYYYVENKFLINTILIILLFISTFAIYYKLYVFKDYYNEGNVVSVNGVNIGVENVYLLKEAEDFYLIGVDFKVNTTLKNKTLYSNDLFLKIENYKILSNNQYCNSYADLGICYNGEILSSDFNNYLIFYELPKIYYNDTIFFEYITVTDEVKFKIDPVKLEEDTDVKKIRIKENLKFDEKTLNNINFKINSFEVSASFPIKYDYCYKKNDCMESVEYLKPTINSNYDKIILKLNLEFNSQSKTYNTFYKFFEKYGSITYKIGEKEYTQKLGFEEIKSNKKTEKNIVYISVIKDVLNANEISLDFNIRNNKYKYILKGE